MDSIRVAIVAGFKEEPDYSQTFFKSLLDQAPPHFQFLVFASQNSVRLPFAAGSVKSVWSDKFFHPFQIWRAVRREKPNLVHLQHEINLFGGGAGVRMLPVLLVLLRLERVPCVITIHALPSLESVKGKFSGLFSYPASAFFSRLIRIGLWLSYRSASLLSDRVIVHSPLLAQRFIREYGGSPEKVRVISHPELAPSENGSIPVVTSPTKGKPYLLFFGYLLRRKGIEDLIESFARVAPDFPDHVLIIAGHAPQRRYEQELKALAADKDLSGRIVFTGYLESKDVFGLVRDCDFLILTARYSFSASGPLAVAMALEKPVVAPALGTFSETLVDGQDGLLYDSTNSSSLTEKMKLLLGDGDLQKKLSQGMREKRTAFSPVKVAKQTLDLYQELANETASRR